MLESGYVRVYRSFLKWEWYDDINTKAVFLHLILTANYEPQKWHGTTIQRGQRVFSYSKLSKELHLSLQQTRTAINHLKSTGEITCEGTSEYSIATVKNYEIYQQPTCEPTNEQQADNKPSTSDQQQWKKEKESNKENNNILSASKPKKHKYGEYQNVLLSDSDIEKLREKFPDWKNKIEILSEGIELKGYKYKNHYLAILKWARRDSSKKAESKATYDLSEYDQATTSLDFDSLKGEPE